REDAAIAPDQVDRQRQQREAEVLAEQRHEIRRQMERRGRRHHQIEQRHQNADDGQGDEEGDGAAIERASDEAGYHAATALPFKANSPRGRFWMNRMISTRMAILASTAPA